ncbi:hypothetical protein M0222_19005 [Myxococcus fulvus]|nr:hypothetical protein [Myxococcus fulvus]
MRFWKPFTRAFQSKIAAPVQTQEVEDRNAEPVRGPGRSTIKSRKWQEPLLLGRHQHYGQ